MCYSYQIYWIRLIKLGTVFDKHNNYAIKNTTVGNDSANNEMAIHVSGW